jgi:hypothetical protein
VTLETVQKSYEPPRAPTPPKRASTMERVALALSDRPQFDLGSTASVNIPRLRRDDDWERISPSEASKEEGNDREGVMSFFMRKLFRGFFGGK